MGPPDPCQIPFTPCWCQSHPSACNGGPPCYPPPCVPISQGIEILMITGILLVIFTKKLKAFNHEKDIR